MKKLFSILLITIIVAASSGKFCAAATTSDNSPAPYLLAVSETAQPGDPINIEGANFGPNPQVSAQLINAQGQPVGAGQSLTVLNSSPNLIQAGTPTSLASGLWQISLQTAGVASNSKMINQARAVCYDAPQATPGGTLRIFGHNMRAAGVSSAVSFVDSLGNTFPGTVTESNAYSLKVQVPSALVPGTSYAVYVSNGLGGPQGYAPAPDPILIHPAGPDPMSLGVSWASELTFLGNVYNVRTDPRLTLHAVGNGIHDDMPALRTAVQSAMSSGGGVVYLPAGHYYLDNSLGALSIKNHVILMGDGMGKSFIQYGRNANTKTWGLDFPNVSLSGLYNLSVENLCSSAAPNGNFVVYNNGVTSKVFLKNVDYNLGNGVYLNLSNVDQLLIANCRFNSRTAHGAPFWMTGCSNFAFHNNLVYYHNGRIQMREINHGVIENNVFSRDGGCTLPRIVENGGLELSFGKDVIVQGNTIVATGVVDTAHNDGEALLTQNGSYTDFRDAGTLTQADGATLQDAAKNWSSVTTFLPRSVVAITSGPAVGQWRTIIAHDATTLTLDRPWDMTPPPGSLYSITSWAGNQMFVLNNTVQNSYRGIEFYEGGWDCAVAGNTLTDAGGIYVRAIDAADRHDPLWNTVIADNQVSNPAGQRLAFVTLALFQVNGPLHGNGILGTEIRRNVIDSFHPGLDGSQAAGINTDGYWRLFSPNAGYAVISDTPGILGTLFSDNSALNMTGQAYHFGTGAAQTAVALAGAVTVN